MLKNSYLGEVCVDIASHPDFSQYTQTDWVILYLEKYRDLNGDEQKTWLLDQVARIVHGAPVEVIQAAWEGGHTEYSYNVGTSAEYEMWIKSNNKNNPKSPKFKF